MYAMEEKGGSSSESPEGMTEKKKELPDADYVDLSPLPDKLRCKLVVLKGSQLGGREGAWGDVILVGTAHLSRESCEEVAQVIRQVQPDVIFMELCSARQGVVDVVEQQEVLRAPTWTELLSNMHNLGIFSTLYSWLLGRAAGSLEVLPGAEFRAAWVEGGKVGAVACFGDRPVNVTVKRLWLGLSAWQKCKLVFKLTWGGYNLPTPEKLTTMVEDMKSSDALTEAVKAMGKDFPTLITTLISERDLYMAVQLQECLSRAVARGYPLRVVGVVGAGHLIGIQRAWTRKDIDIAKLMEVPDETVSLGDDDEEDHVLDKGGLASGLVQAEDILDLRSLLRSRRKKWRRLRTNIGGVCVVVAAVACMCWMRSQRLLVKARRAGILGKLAG